MAPRVGLEPTTTRLTAAGSTIELPRNMAGREGFEPSLMVLETIVLPLHYRPKWRRIQESNLYYQKGRMD